MVKTVRDFNVGQKRILVRCDFNVPLDNHGNIMDDFRIKESLPTIQYLIGNEAKVILMSHLDPKNQGLVAPEFTLKLIADKLSKYLAKPVRKTNNCVGQEVLAAVNSLKDGEVVLLENLRFHGGEVDNIPEFATKLSLLGDIYINDAFSVCHRSHASVVGTPQYLPHGMGLLLEKELFNLDKVLKNPKRPMVAIIGGTKVQTKAKFLEKILRSADMVIVSGLIKKEILGKKLTFNYAEKMIGPEDDLGTLDINEKTIAQFKEKILAAKTILWNGPFGKFEDEKYKKGTLEIAKAIIESRAFSVAGGGETVEFLNKEGLALQFSWVSTGGGAMLAYLSGETLPGLKALE